MLKTLTKRGRPQACYRTSWDTRIQGLLRRADGRWKISATGQTFVEPDERLAISRFFALTRPAQTVLDITGPVPPEGLHDLFVGEAFIGDVIPADAIPAVVQNGKISLGRLIPEVHLWAWMREQLVFRPEYAARMTGFEQLAYLSEVRRPGKSALLADLGALYQTKPGLSSNEAGRSKLFWKEFTRAVHVETVREITHDAVRIYELATVNKCLAPKSIKHRYMKVRTILAYAMERGESIEDCRRAMDVCAMLKSRDSTALNPNPITPEQFYKVHWAAEKKGDHVFAALMLLAINACMYSSEVAALQWTEIDLQAGELVTSRRKTGVSRVAILWPETVAALVALPQVSDSIFNTRVRSFTTFSVLAAWRRYRKLAGLGTDITFSMIRDAAYTLACRSVPLEKARVLAGHRLPGSTDHYVKRNPGFVQEACEAIRRGFWLA